MKKQFCLMVVALGILLGDVRVTFAQIADCSMNAQEAAASAVRAIELRNPGWHGLPIYMSEKKELRKPHLFFFSVEVEYYSMFDLEVLTSGAPACGIISVRTL